ncbi:hypothetical protein [Photorhabdus hindustanensis]|uniref:Uncharacterized protein n=1 Tax=Photorhabdus hindustanensis TaxID=2918802 RepID=A0A2S8PUL7_9GAMM|nr:hypothetical protein [Photorhabdus hindustanensis]PQQ22505.1 hypothetical protein C6H66_23270 [Photorhabdus hindustanensis]
MKTEVDLIYFEKNREEGTQLSKYYVSHTNSKTILEQILVIEKDRFGRYTPKMEFTDFPELESEKEAALKLADWMRRMSEAIEDHWQDKKQYPEPASLAEQWKALPSQSK